MYFAGCLGVHCVFTGKAIHYFLFLFQIKTLACENILLCNSNTNARVFNNYTLNDLDDNKKPSFPDNYYPELYIY